MKLVVAKDASRTYPEAVVMDTDAENRIIYRSGLGFNKRGKADCYRWLTKRKQTPA